VNRAFSKIQTVLEKSGSTTSELIAKPEEKKRNVFKRLFSRKKDSKEQPTEEELNEEYQEEVSKEFNQIREEESLKEISSNEKLLELKKLDAATMNQINELIDYLQIQSEKDLEKINIKAKKEGQRTNFIVALFILFTLVMLGMVIYNVYKYLKHSRSYNKALMKAKKESDELAMAKSSFLATMSHEIRTPMNAILGFSEQLTKSTLPEKEQKQVGIIHDSASYLVKIIDETLEVSKLDANKLQLDNHPFVLREFIETLTEQIQPLVKKGNNVLKINISKELADYYKGDTFRIKQILFNILGNAVKFTSYGIIELNVREHETKAGTLVFEIKDNGIGMTEKEQSKIFNEYEQADQLIEKKFGGTGLGLPITKKLVDLFKGSIRVDSEKGVGTVFTIELPLEPSEKPEIQEALKIDTSKLKGKHILVADDSELNRKLLKNILGKQEVIVSVASDGKEALNAIEKGDFELILMDIHMNEMDGIAFIQHFREKHSHKNIPVLALTAFGENEQYYLDLGFNGLVRKPFKEHHLLTQILSVLDSFQSEPQLLNLKAFKRSIGDDKEFYIEMLETFIRSAEEGLDAIRSGMKNEDLTLISESAHRIAPSFSQLGANAEYEILKKFEKISRNKKLSKALVADFEQLEKRTVRIIEMIRTEIKGTNPS
jgi:signal transduction histidine kinase/DNA-binding response OmpR family regulator